MGDEYFKNKYRVASTRLTDWDYSKEGFYYVTICAQDRICCFGEIKDKNVYLSEIGKIVFEELLKTPQLRLYVKLDDFIIMPNHIHAIFEIQKDNDLVNEHCRDTARHVASGKNDFGLNNRRDAVHRVSTGNKFGPLKPKSLSSIINTFKGAVSKECHENNLDFYWQTNYYEHIITNDEDYARIKEYIALNPINWEFSKNNPKNFK
jgi:putative transposase